MAETLVPRVGMSLLKLEKQKLSVWDFFWFGLIFILFFPKARLGNMSVLGIKAHLNVPDVFAPRHCEAVLLLTGWAWGRAKLRALCALCSSLSSCWCREQRFLVGLASSCIHTALGRNFNFSSTTKENMGADTFLVYDT